MKKQIRPPKFVSYDDLRARAIEEVNALFDDGNEAIDRLAKRLKLLEAGEVIQHPAKLVLKIVRSAKR